MAAGALQAVFHESDPVTVKSVYHAAIDAVGSMSAPAGAILEDAESGALAYPDFPAEHRRRIRTNNLQVRMNREIRRRSRACRSSRARSPRCA